MTSPEASRYEQPTLPAFNRADMAELEDAHALAAETGHPAGLSVREELYALDNQNRVERGAASLEATPQELSAILESAYEAANAGALRNHGKPRIPKGEVAFRLMKAGIFTMKQMGQAVDYAERSRVEALAGVSSDPQPHIPDHMERAAHDRIDG